MFRSFVILVSTLLLCTGSVFAKSVFKVEGKTYSEEELFNKYNGQLFELEQQRFRAYTGLANQVYLDNYWEAQGKKKKICLLYTSPSPRDRTRSRMPSSA